MIKLKISLLLSSLLIFSQILASCSEEVRPTTPDPIVDENPGGEERLSMRNGEIRQDIINALVAQEIEHWINEDGSIGFNSEDAERVDAIGYAAIGAYAARN